MVWFLAFGSIRCVLSLRRRWTHQKWQLMVRATPCRTCWLFEWINRGRECSQRFDFGLFMPLRRRYIHMYNPLASHFRFSPNVEIDRTSFLVREIFELCETCGLWHAWTWSKTLSWGSSVNKVARSQEQTSFIYWGVYDLSLPLLRVHVAY